MAWRSLIPALTIGNTKEDLKEAERVEQYRISKKAVYLQSEYLPISEIKECCIQPSTLRVKGCCGRGVPIYKVRVDYGAERPAVLAIESEKKAKRAVELIRAQNPAVIEREYVSPTGGDPNDRFARLFS